MSHRLSKPAVVLTPDQRARVLCAIRRHVEVRAWQLHAVAVRTQHVHVIVAAPAVAPSGIAQQLKAWSTRALRNASMLDGRVWSRGQSIRRLYDENGLASVVSYVAENQGRPRG